MDQQRLDRLAVALAYEGSRRRLLSTAVGLTAGIAATLVAGGEVVARRRRRLHAVCGANKECASGRCRKSRCACPVDQETCGDVCCGAGEYCCNPLSSTCAPIGGGCGGDEGGCH